MKNIPGPLNQFIIFKEKFTRCHVNKNGEIWAKKNYAPLKREHIVLQLVGRSICRFVDQVLSAQYLLAPSFDQIKLSAGLALNE